MRFMIIHNSNEANEAGIRPSKEMIAGVHKILGEAVQQGIFLAGEGVHASSKGARLTHEGGKFTVTDGPFAEAKELIAGFVIVDLPSKQDAIEWAKRYAEVLGDVRLEIRQVVEAADLKDPHSA
ncbi:MAG TPA: YciI family protein [Roseiflexaceae bacterium]|nr:YciI family protein [Roseiflexaceae bacterium]